VAARTLFDKVWDAHVVDELGDGMQLLFVDRHLMHELSGVRGQKELAKRGLRMRNPELTLGTFDHVVSTVPGVRGGGNPGAQRLIGYFREESRKAGIALHDFGDDGQGIVHVVGPELGFTLPGTLLVCGDSHTCTHGALGALAWGIGTSELTHVLATLGIRYLRMDQIDVALASIIVAMPAILPIVWYMMKRLSAEHTAD